MHHNLFANKNALFSFEAFTSNKNSQNNILLFRILDKNNNNKEYFLLDSKGKIEKVNEEFINNNFKNEKGIEYLNHNQNTTGAANNISTNEKFLKVRMKENYKNFSNIQQFIQPNLYKNNDTIIDEQDDNSLITNKDIIEVCKDITTILNTIIKPSATNLDSYLEKIFKMYTGLTKMFNIDFEINQGKFLTNYDYVKQFTEKISQEISKNSQANVDTTFSLHQNIKNHFSLKQLT